MSNALAKSIEPFSGSHNRTSSRFNSYPKYRAVKKSVVDAVPEHWEIPRWKYVVLVNPPKSECDSLAPSEEVTFLPMESIGERGELLLDQTKALDAVANGYTYFRDQDVIVAKITPCFENGKGALAKSLTNGVGFGTTELHVLRAKGKTDPRFIYLVTTSDAFRKLGSGEMYGAGGQKRVPESFITELRHPLPPSTEQTIIADFLDHQTAKIDGLIEKKRKLIELLKEKRMALISHAVTKGLDPTAPLKDSGVEWLGKVPAHWSVRKLKQLCRRITDGAHISPDQSGSDYPFVSTVDISDEGIDFVNCLRTSLECYEYLVRNGCKPFTGDVLFSKDGTVGRTALIDFNTDFVVASSLVIITPNLEQLSSKFLDYWLNNSLLQQEIALQLSGAALRRISIEKVARLPVPIPPPEEQVKIAIWIELNESKYRQLISKGLEGIEHLKEYRSALISAAVTGKIDVRDWKPPVAGEQAN